jgi:DHA2 family multidrug resistance protein
MWYMTFLPQDASFGFFAWARVYQMVGLPFLFVPITTASYAGLPPAKTNQASALINVARNLGGSIGVSVATTMLARRSQFHEARLAEHIFAASPPYQTALSRLTGDLSAGAAGSSGAQHQAIGLIEQTVEAQASLLSYIDVFWMFAILAAVMIPLALLMLKNVAQPAAGEAVAAGH